MAFDEVQHTQELLDTTRRRLQHLEKQAALHGHDSDPGVLIEIEDARREIQRLLGALAAYGPPADRVASAPTPRADALARAQDARIPARIPCPYPGMSPFSAADTRFFYGRDAEISQILQHLRHHRFLFVIGPSGSGKSSLISAGVVPRLPTSTYFPPSFWRVCELRPGRQPMPALAELFQGELARPPQAVQQLIDAQPAAQRLLLIIDQFEEVFSQAEPAERARFIAALQALRALPACALIIVLRADFYADIMTSALWPIDLRQRIEITPPRGSALRQAIEQPALDVGVQLEPGLLEQLLADAAGEPGLLPMIQETMALLWERMVDGRLALHAYQRLGDERRSGLAAAMALKADAVLAELAPDRQIVARRIFLRLIQFGEGRADTRRQLTIGALRSSDSDPRRFAEVLDQLTNNRLLTLSGMPDGVRKVDIAHESLIAGWPTLQSWLAERREAEQIRRRLELKVAEWVRLGRGRGGLLDEVELPEVESWLATPDAEDLGLDETLLDLVLMSQRALGVGRSLNAPPAEPERPSDAAQDKASVPFGFLRRWRNRRTDAGRAEQPTERAWSEANAYRDQMRALYEVAYALSTTMNYQSVLDAALSESHKLVHYTVGLVLLATSQADELYVAAAYGAPESDKTQRIQVGRGGIGQALRSADPCIIPDISGEPEVRSISALARCRSACLVPLRAAARVYGVMIIAGDPPSVFSQEQLGMVTALANYVIIALHNAQLVHDLREERARLLSKEEEVRRRLARDLHDGPAQALAAITMNVEFIKRLIERDPARVQGELDRMGELAKRTTHEVRTMLFELRPLVLETQGLDATLRQYFERLQTSGAEIVLESSNITAELDTKTEGTLFNIIQESVNNALKHAKAQHIWVRLKQTPLMLETTVQDDGHGFDLQKTLESYAQRGSFGLLNIGERAKLSGGFAEIYSAPGQGTTVRVVVPLS